MRKQSNYNLSKNLSVESFREYELLTSNILTGFKAR